MVSMSLNVSGSYSDKSFGVLMDGMVRQAKRDCIVLFRDYLCGITSREDEMFQLEFGSVKASTNKGDTIYIAEDSIVKVQIDDPKNVGFALMQSFRKMSTVSDDDNFPVKELSLRFVKDYENHILID